MTTPPVCSYEGSDYQTSFWEKGGRAYEDACEASALKRLLPPQGEHLLELGAGAGRNTPRYHGYKRITLLDYSRTQLEQAREKLGDSPGYRYIAADIYHLAGDGDSHSNGPIGGWIDLTGGTGKLSNSGQPCPHHRFAGLAGKDLHCPR